MNDNEYWAARRRGEDDALRRAAAEASRCEQEVIAGEALGLKPYTWAWAEWSRRWQTMGRPLDGAAALASAKAEVPAAYESATLP
jgi:hypothetical protein